MTADRLLRTGAAATAAVAMTLALSSCSVSESIASVRIEQALAGLPGVASVDSEVSGDGFTYAVRWDTRVTLTADATAEQIGEIARAWNAHDAGGGTGARAHTDLTIETPGEAETSALDLAPGLADDTARYEAEHWAGLVDRFGTVHVGVDLAWGVDGIPPVRKTWITTTGWENPDDLVELAREFGAELASSPAYAARSDALGLGHADRVEPSLITIPATDEVLDRIAAFEAPFERSLEGDDGAETGFAATWEAQLGDDGLPYADAPLTIELALPSRDASDIPGNQYADRLPETSVWPAVLDFATAVAPDDAHMELSFSFGLGSFARLSTSTCVDGLDPVDDALDLRLREEWAGLVGAPDRLGCTG